MSDDPIALVVVTADGKELPGWALKAGAVVVRTEYVADERQMKAWVSEESVAVLAAAAVKLADIHDETVDGEWGCGYGETITDEAEAVRVAAAPFVPKVAPDA